MICRKCGKEIPDESLYCSHCGCDLRNKALSSCNYSSDEQIPLMFLIKQVVKHKIAVIITIVIVILGFGGYIAMRKFQEKKQAETAFMQEFDRIMEIVGTYKNSDITLVLSIDNTATITYNKGSLNERYRKGYWREKFEGGMIEIEFSKSLEDIYVGNEKHYYCRTLYLVGNRLWESMSAINSHDYGVSEYLTKE